MTATQGRRAQRSQARRRHPTALAKPDGRGPRRPSGRRTPLFLILFATSLMLTALGAVMVLSASAAVSVADTDSAWNLFRRQVQWVGLGIATLLVTMRIPYQRWRVVATPALGFCVVLLVAVAIPGVGDDVNGARRWLGVGPLTLQPSELVKFALIVFVADLLARPGRRMDIPAITLRPVVFVTGLVLGLLMLQPHLGAALVIGTVVVAMLFLAGAPLRHLTGLGLLSAGGAALFVVFTPWRRKRLLAFTDPWLDPEGAGYQPIQSLYAITSGGLTGVGLGGSYAKWGFLPYAHTDFIFAVLAEELGLIGAASVILAFVVIGAAGFTAALRAPDRFGLLVGVGITTWITAQAALNLGAVMSVLPVTGVTLPFLSFGGSSLVVTLGAVGVLCNIARQGR